MFNHLQFATVHSLIIDRDELEHTHTQLCNLKVYFLQHKLSSCHSRALRQRHLLKIVEFHSAQQVILGVFIRAGAACEHREAGVCQGRASSTQRSPFIIKPFQTTLQHRSGKTRPAGRRALDTSSPVVTYYTSSPGLKKLTSSHDIPMSIKPGYRRPNHSQKYLKLLWFV